MAEVPIYSSKAAAPNIGSLSIRPVTVPDLHSGEGLSEGLQMLGEAVNKYAAFKKNADETVRTNTAMTGYITGLDQAEQEAVQSPDYETAPQDFHKKAEELAQKALADANPDPVARSALELRLKSISLPAGGRVQAAALGKQVDAATATRGQQALYLSRAASAATSPAERQAMIDQQLSTIDTNVKAGYLSADKGEAEKQAFLKSVDDQFVRQLIRTDPMAAQKALADPTRWKGFSGSELESYRANAETAADQAQKDHIIGLAQGSKPEQASLAMNKVLSPQHADSIYYNGVTKVAPGGGAGGWWTSQRQAYAVNYLMKNAGLSEIGARGLVARWRFVEAAGGPGAVNRSSGAIGIGQWLGDRKGGVKLGDFEGQLAHAAAELTGSESKAGDVLRAASSAQQAAVGASMFERAEGYNAATGTDNFTAKTLGGIGAVGNGKEDLTHWHQSLDAFPNNLALGAAAYVGGLDKAKEYEAAAVAKFGDNPTPLEVASIISDKTTHDFVLQLFGYLGVPPTGPGVSRGARVQTQTAVESVVGKQQTEADRIIKEQAAMDRATGGNDALDDLNKAGVAAWTPQFETVLQHNIQAAAAGDTAAAAFVEKAKTWAEAKPSTDAAWRMAPPRLDDEVTRLAAAAAGGTATHADLVQLAAFKAVQSEIGTNAKTDPVGLGARAGLYTDQSLDPNAAPDDPRFLTALAVRGGQATRAEAVYNTLAPFRPKEVDALKQRFDEAGVPEKLALLNAFRQTLDDRTYKAALDQLGLDPATATAGRFAPEDPAIAKKILIGETYKKVPGAEKAGATLTAAANEAIGGNIYPPGSPALADVLTAAENVYLANRGPDALFKPPDVTAMKAAVTEVVGELVDIGGRKTPAPPGISAPRFTELFDHLTDEQLATVGRAANPRVPGLNQVVDVGGRPVTAEELQSHAVLTQRVPRGSEYFVGDAAGNNYFHEDGSPVVLDFRMLDATAAHTIAADSAAASRAGSAAATAAAAATPASETRRKGAGALFGDQPLGGVEPAPPEPPAAAPAIDPRRPLPVDSSKTTIFKSPPIGAGTGGLE